MSGRKLIRRLMMTMAKTSQQTTILQFPTDIFQRIEDVYTLAIVILITTLHGHAK